jgi:hypothetical protein
MKKAGLRTGLDVLTEDAVFAAVPLLLYLLEDFYCLSLRG